MYTLNVLTPNGRRQQIKVTPNTTLLQVLEEVCTKHGFKAEEYDLRHHNKVLDVSSMFRFTSLPNNAQLEMTEALKQRQESEVTVGLQLESGERLTGVFSPSDTVWDAIATLKPEEIRSSNLVVIYMRQEIVGRQNLQTTTLRSLGLTGGRAMLRLMHKSPEELRTQANVTTNLSRVIPPEEKPTQAKANQGKSKSPESPKKNKLPESTKKSPSPEPKKKEDSGSQTPVIPSPDKSANHSREERYFDPRENIFQRLLKDEKTKNELVELRKKTESSKPKNPLTENFQVISIPESKHKEEEKKSPKMERKIEKLEKIKEDLQSDSKVIVLGERNAVAYNLNNVKPVAFEEEPDDFYDLTIADAKILLREAKQLCEDLEEAPLMTSAQRELEKDKKVLMLLNQYKKTVLRIKFPDRTVLQGTFSPLEPVSAVEKFVASYLENPDIKFYLYTTPPKVILRSEERLMECGCVPCSVLYFGIPAEMSPPSEFLKSEVLSKMSTPSAAALTAYESRGLDRKSPTYKSEEVEKRRWSKNSQGSEPGTSGSGQWENKSKEQSSPQFKVPKWFKTSK